MHPGFSLGGAAGRILGPVYELFLMRRRCPGPRQDAYKTSSYRLFELSVVMAWMNSYAPVRATCVCTHTSKHLVP